MARTRAIKPEFWSDEKLAKLSRDSRLIFIGLWSASDDYGVVKGHPAWLKAQLFPYDGEIKIAQFEKWLDEIEDAGMIVHFTTNEESYYFIRHFTNHQKVDHPSKQRNPPPPTDILSRQSRNIREDSRHILVETETETETETYICAKPKPSRASKYTTEFLQFYEAYPRKVGKEPAWKAWKKRNGNRPDIETIMKILEEQKQSDQWQKDGGQFVPMPATWLNQGRWADELEGKGGIGEWLKTTSEE